MRQQATIHIRRALLASAAVLAVTVGAELAQAADIVRPLPQRAAPIAAPAPSSMWLSLDAGRFTYKGTQFFGGDPAPGWFVNAAVGTNNPNGWNFTVGGGYATSKRHGGAFTGIVAAGTPLSPSTVTVTGAPTSQSENRYFLDFLAGRDVGL